MALPATLPSSALQNLKAWSCNFHPSLLSQPDWEHKMCACASSQLEHTQTNYVAISPMCSALQSVPYWVQVCPRPCTSINASVATMPLPLPD